MSSCGPTDIFFYEIYLPRWCAKWHVGSRCDISRWQHCRTHKRLERLQQLHECPPPRTMENMHFLHWFLGWSFCFGLWSCGLWITTLNTIWCPQLHIFLRPMPRRCWAMLRWRNSEVPIADTNPGGRPWFDKLVVTKGFYLEAKIPVDKFKPFVVNIDIDIDKYIHILMYIKEYWGNLSPSLKLSVPKSQASN